MDAPRFDRLSERLAAAGSRRRALQALAGLSLGATALTLEAGEAKPARKRRGVAAEHWRKQKRYYCLDGKTIRRYRRKQKKLLARGATRGWCQRCSPGRGDCAGGCCNDGLCAPGTAATACGVGGATCAACGAGESCEGGVCVAPVCAPDGSCAPGCCDGVSCQPGDDVTACGTRGDACSQCTDGRVCQNQRCCTPVGLPCHMLDPGACCSSACRDGICV